MPANTTHLPTYPFVCRRPCKYRALSFQDDHADPHDLIYAQQSLNLQGWYTAQTSEYGYLVPLVKSQGTIHKEGGFCTKTSSLMDFR